MTHRTPKRYRVLWKNLAGELYAHDRSTMRTAIAEARSLHKSSVPWQDIQVHDVKGGVVWCLRPAQSPEVFASPSAKRTETEHA